MVFFPATSLSKSANIETLFFRFARDFKEFFSLMTFLQGCILFIAAILGGTLNSVAGGGTFITLPALIFTGVLPINANASSTVALWPGSIASVWAYRKEFANQRRLVTILLSITSLIGGILGAELLVNTS